jgi:hypothetical protein
MSHFIYCPSIPRTLPRFHTVFLFLCEGCVLLHTTRAVSLRNGSRDTKNTKCTPMMLQKRIVSVVRYHESPSTF